jgi:hypothetical protein
MIENYTLYKILSNTYDDLGDDLGEETKYYFEIDFDIIHIHTIDKNGQCDEIVSGKLARKSVCGRLYSLKFPGFGGGADIDLLSGTIEISKYNSHGVVCVVHGHYTKNTSIFSKCCSVIYKRLS